MDGATVPPGRMPPYEAPTHEDAEWADAILFGTPCYFGAMATELKNYLDLLGPQ